MALFGLLLYAGEQGDGKADPTRRRGCSRPSTTRTARPQADRRAVSPADTPPAGTVGYYSDGALHAAVVRCPPPGGGCSSRCPPTDALHERPGLHLRRDFD